MVRNFCLYDNYQHTLLKSLMNTKNLQVIKNNKQA